MPWTDKIKPVCENDRCRFYRTNVTEAMDNLAQKRSIPVKCLLAKQKSDNTIEYVLIENEEIIYVSQKSEDIYCHIEMMYYSNKENN